MVWQFFARARCSLSSLPLSTIQTLVRGLTLWGSVGLSVTSMQPLLSAGACNKTVFTGPVVQWAPGHRAPLPFPVPRSTHPALRPGHRLTHSFSLELFQLAYQYGGSVSVLWGFILCTVLSLPLALSLAEIASRHTNAGGIYYFAGVLGAPLGKLPAFLSGWLYTLASLGGSAAIALQCVQQAVSLRMMYTYGYQTAAGSPSGTLDEQFAWTVLVLVVASAIACLPQPAIDVFAKSSLAFLMMSTLLICIVLPTVAPRTLASKNVWTSDTFRSSATTAGFDGMLAGSSSTGRSAYTFCVGLLPAQFLILLYDTPAFLSEETMQASRTVPRSIVITFLLGCSMNLAMLVSYCYSITNAQNVAVAGFGITGSCPVDAAGQPVNSAPGGCILSNGAPFTYYGAGTIIYDAFAARFPACSASALDSGVCAPGCCDVTGAIRPKPSARNAAIFIASLPLIGCFSAVVNISVGVSRFVYAFARDGGFPVPLSRFLARLLPWSSAPAAAVAFLLLFGIAFAAAWTNKSPTVAFAAATGITANAVLFCFGLPCLLRVTVARRSFLPTPDFALGRFSVPCAVMGAAYGTFACATIALPALWPINVHSLNWAGPALGAAFILTLVLFAAATVLPDSMWCFSGPKAPPMKSVSCGNSPGFRSTDDLLMGEVDAAIEPENP